MKKPVELNTSLVSGCRLPSRYMRRAGFPLGPHDRVKRVLQDAPLVVCREATFSSHSHREELVVREPRHVLPISVHFKTFRIDGNVARILWPDAGAQSLDCRFLIRHEDETELKSSQRQRYVRQFAQGWGVRYRLNVFEGVKIHPWDAVLRKRLPNLGLHLSDWELSKHEHQVHNFFTRYVHKGTQHMLQNFHDVDTVWFADGTTARLREGN